MGLLTTENESLVCKKNKSTATIQGPNVDGPNTRVLFGQGVAMRPGPRRKRKRICCCQRRCSTHLRLCMGPADQPKVSGGEIQSWVDAWWVAVWEEEEEDL
uniref:Uncharacterized protein n=1 Tax=Eutreptiella gymnastica TaxID=73025 RepID=A0A7S4FRF5_9EUGL